MDDFLCERRKGQSTNGTGRNGFREIQRVGGVPEQFPKFGGKWFFLILLAINFGR